MCSKRNVLIDSIRGICILLMVMDHFFLLYNNLIDYNFFGYKNVLFRVFCLYYLNFPLRLNVRYIVMSLLFFISGYCGKYSRNNINRFRKMLLYDAMLSIGTFLIEIILNYKCFIICGVLFCYATYLLIYVLFDLERKSVYCLLEVLLVFAIFEIIRSSVDYKMDSNYLLFFGFPSKDYIPGFEYVPPIKFFWAFLFGIVFGKLHKDTIIVQKKKYTILSYVGEKGVIIYFSHFLLIITIILFL